MKLKDKKIENVIITVKSKLDNKSKSVTVYEVSVDEMLNAIKQMIINK